MSNVNEHAELSRPHQTDELKSRVDSVMLHHANLDRRVSRLEGDMQELIGGFKEIKGLVVKTYERVNNVSQDFWDRVYKYLMIGYIIGSLVYVSMIYGDMINAATMANNWHSTHTQ